VDSRRCERRSLSPTDDTLVDHGAQDEDCLIVYCGDVLRTGELPSRIGQPVRADTPAPGLGAADP